MDVLPAAILEVGQSPSIAMAISLDAVSKDEELGDPYQLQELTAEGFRLHPAACGRLRAERRTETDEGRSVPASGSVVSDEQYP